MHFTEQHSLHHGEGKAVYAKDEGNGEEKLYVEEVKNGVYKLRRKSVRRMRADQGRISKNSKPKMSPCAICYRHFATKQKVQKHKLYVEEATNRRSCNIQIS